MVAFLAVNLEHLSLLPTWELIFNFFKFLKFPFLLSFFYGAGIIAVLENYVFLLLVKQLHSEERQSKGKIAMQTIVDLEHASKHIYDMGTWRMFSGNFVEIYSLRKLYCVWNAMWQKENIQGRANIHHTWKERSCHTLTVVVGVWK